MRRRLQRRLTPPGGAAMCIRSVLVAAFAIALLQGCGSMEPRQQASMDARQQASMQPRQQLSTGRAQRSRASIEWSTLINQLLEGFPDKVKAADRQYFER